MTNLGQIKVNFSYKGIERPKTVCTIKNAEGELLVQSFVKKSKEDSADKALGRFNAFKKAMNVLAFENRISRQERTIAWNSFKTTMKAPQTINLTPTV